MQEEAGSVEEKKTKRKSREIPTVDAIMAAETQSAENQAEEKAVEEKPEPEEKPQVEEKSSETESKPETEETSQAEEKAQSEEKPSVQEEKPAQEESLQEEDTLDEEAAEELRARRESMNLDSETALLETVLFLESEPQNTESLAKITQFSVNVVEECLSRLKEKYTQQDSGIELSKIIGGWILTPKKECFDFVKERYGKRNEGRLSKAAIETLAIIAYSQPITRAEIESIRHVNVDNMMRILLDRKFIKEAGKKDVPGKPTLYATTKEFLEFFNLQSIADLPQLDEKESQRFELAR